ncbi:hypothetical protein K461DRAFT_273314 [Myriangium duriaei CBS 260.36]|uniref:SUR7 family protein pun1 n=1 Tax=Myriangium duriaei CBS 260.36 TaxID=1168546 RepID=A0A9P4JDU3_9PEZI|nr:hypothetical protein K461DRAFT_273314 [Myriangium duriaei CBS 260.36]
MFGRSRKNKEDAAATRGSVETERTSSAEGKTSPPAVHEPTKAQIKRATRIRRVFAFITSFLLLVSVVFLILVELGNTSKKSSILNKIYFIKLNLANIIPESVPDAFIVNSIARTLGLHDFYQVGLWGFCEGYNDEGVTDCSKNKTLYWFNPVQIILSELLAGATISLPSEVSDILNLIRLVSNWMFGLFLSGACLAFVMIFVAPLSIISRWIALATSILTFAAALFITVASVIATVMFIIMRNAFTSVADLNIQAEIGIRMFVFMWIAAGAAILAALIQIGECCCCASRRDIKTGRKRGSKKAWVGGMSPADEKKAAKRGVFGKKK